MKDAILLLVSATCLALAAWFFWYGAGESGFSILSTIALIVLLADNVRLRRQLRRNNPE